MRPIVRKCSFVFYSVLALSAPAFAAVTITSPANGSDVTSPFTLTATAGTCSSQTVTSMTYSLDSGSDIATVSDNTMNLEVSSGIGEHTIHVKAWGDTGAVCVTDVAVKVTGADGAEALPSNAASVGSIQAIRSWIAGHDAATHGSSYGSTALVSTPSRGGSSRRFETHFTNGGGERYHVDLGDDATATNFVYDAWIYIAGSASGIGRLEMDLNQVMANGETAIFGFQCDAASGRWDYTANRGSAKHYSDLWVPSRA
jgi:hypothetical protein